MSHRQSPNGSRNRLRPSLIALALTALALGPVAASSAATTTEPGASTAPIPTAVDAHGITVLETREVTGLERSYDYLIDSDLVTGEGQTTHGLALRVTLPEDYAQTDADYPVLYLLNGNPGNYTEWTEKADVERITADSGIIVVSVEGGETSWYTDWLRSNGQGRQNQWRTFHNEQVVPFIDANLRTLATREHRGIAGFSMGGFGALRYAQQYPELYSYSASFSGGVDLEDQTIRTAVVGSLATQGWNISGPFGPVTWPLDRGWREQNPVRAAHLLDGTTVSLYAGSGRNDLDIYERGAGWSTRTMAQSLTSAGVEHHFDMYGRNVSYDGIPCDGGHNWTCASMAFAKEKDRMVQSIGAQD